MAARTTIFLFSLFVVLCLSQTDPLHITTNGDIKYGLAFNFTIPATNLRTSATFSIAHNVSVVVCFQERFPIANGSQFSNETCTFFFNFSNSGTHSEEVPLRNLPYNVGVYFASEAITPENTTHVNVIVTGPTCHPDLFYDSIRGHCVGGSIVAINSTTNITNDNTTVINVVTEGIVPQTKFFVIEAPELLGSVSASLGEGDADERVIVRMRFAGTPSNLYNDAYDFRGTAKFNSPRPGHWIIGVEIHIEGQFQLHIGVENCATRPGFAGPGCGTPYSKAANNMTLVALPDKYHYWSFVATTLINLNVSLTTLDHQHLPYLLLSRGNVPTLGNADIINCNQGYCSVVRSVHLNVSGTEDELWFIGVTASVTEGNTTFGIWFNETCAPECETDNHGTCQVDGTCDCQIDFTGIDCTTSKGLGPQYIVLIIIASLVVASAIIGFVAWAYMRRKRVNYELVS